MLYPISTEYNWSRRWIQRKVKGTDCAIPECWCGRNGISCNLEEWTVVAKIGLYLLSVFGILIIMDKEWYCDLYPVFVSSSRYLRCSCFISNAGTLSGTRNSITEHSPEGMDFERQFLIIPGLRPHPGSPIWNLPSTLYLSGSPAPHRVNLKRNLSSPPPAVEQSR